MSTVSVIAASSPSVGHLISVAIPFNHLDAIAVAVAEHEHRAVKWIKHEAALYNRCQPVYLLPHFL